MVRKKPYQIAEQAQNDISTLSNIRDTLRGRTGTVTIDLSQYVSRDYYGRTLRQTFCQGLSESSIDTYDGLTIKYYTFDDTMWYIEKETTSSLNRDNRQFDVVIHGDARILSDVLTELIRELVTVKNKAESDAKKRQRKMAHA